MRKYNLNERQMKKEKQNLYFHILRGRLQWVFLLMRN
jgi:hypothetical protein